MTMMTDSKLMRPDEIKAHLDECVIGQDHAKKVLSVAVYNHYKRLQHESDPECTANVSKSNILLMGPTGCGKTMLVTTIAKLLDVPYYIGNATSITASGYVGDDIESLLSGLLMSCDYDVEKAKRGIVFIDEVDKLAKKNVGPSNHKDVSGECVQQGLLKMVEGHVMGVQPHGGRKHPEEQLIYLDTTNILFIISGAFEGLEGIVRRRLGMDTSKIGFAASSKVQSAAGAGSSSSNLLSKVTAGDLREFGLIPEFVGRFPVVTSVEPLGKDALRDILTKPKDSIIAQYSELLRQDGFELKFSDEALDWFVEKAIATGTGARGLRSIIEKYLMELMYIAPKMAAKGKQGRITITPESFSGGSNLQDIRNVKC